MTDAISSSSTPSIFIDANQDSVDDKTNKPIPISSVVTATPGGTTWVQTAQPVGSGDETK